MWLDIAEDDRTLLVGTAQRRLFKFILPEITNRADIKENDTFKFRQVVAKYPKNQDYPFKTATAVLVGQDVWYAVAGDDVGTTTVWANRKELEDSCGTVLKIHSSAISGIHVTQNQDFIFTIGLEDEAIIEWKVEVIEDTENRPFISTVDCTTKGDHRDEVMIKLELRFCENSSSERYLQNSISWFRGVTNKMLNNLLSSSVDEIREDMKLDRRYPRLSLRLEHVYGFEVAV